MRDTFPGVSATMQVMAVSPYTPRAVNVFRSACAPAPALLSEPAIVRGKGEAAVWYRRAFLLSIGSGGRNRRYRTDFTRRGCRWPRPGNLPSPLCRAPLLQAIRVVCKRRSAPHHRCDGNSQVRFHGKDRSQCTGHRRRTFHLHFRGIYLRRRPFFKAGKNVVEGRMNQNWRNGYLPRATAPNPEDEDSITLVRPR